MDAFDRRWFAYAWFVLVWVWVVVFSNVLARFAWGSGAVENMLSIVWWGVILATIVAALWALVGYYYDAKHLREIDADWRPRWGIWVLGHIIFSPMFIAPIYLAVRTHRTGSPFG